MKHIYEQLNFGAWHSGYEILFDKNFCHVINVSEKSIMFKGKMKGNVYITNFSELIDQKVVCLMCDTKG